MCYNVLHFPQAYPDYVLQIEKSMRTPQAKIRNKIDITK